MSETTEPPASTKYGCTIREKQRGDERYPVADVTFGKALDRRVTVRQPGMLDQFDLAEFSGDAGSNETWTNMALVAMSVEEIDGVPRPPIVGTAIATRKAALRETIKRLGEGVPAAAYGISMLRGGDSVDEGDGVAAAKN